MAYSGLTRPTYQLAPVIVVGTFTLFCLLPAFKSLRRRMIVASVTVFISAVLILGGYMFYNAQNFGYTGITPLLGFNLNTKTWRMIDRIPDEYNIERGILTKYRNAMILSPEEQHKGDMYIWWAIPELLEETGMGYAALSKHMMQINLGLIMDNPVDYIKEVLRSLSLYWFPSTDYVNWPDRVALSMAMLHETVLFAYLLLTGVLTSLCIFAFSLTFKHGWGIVRGFVPHVKIRLIAFVLFNGLILYTMLISVIVEVGNPRYRVPTDILIVTMLILSADTLYHIWQKTSEKFSLSSIAAKA